MAATSVAIAVIPSACLRPIGTFANGRSSKIHKFKNELTIVMGTEMPIRNARALIALTFCLMDRFDFGAWSESLVS